MPTNTTLSDRLEGIQGQISALVSEASILMAAAPKQPVDHDALTRSWRINSRDRYAIVGPDGDLYPNVPGIRYIQTTFVQRPAAIREAKRLPGARIYDLRERTFVEAN